MSRDRIVAAVILLFVAVCFALTLRFEDVPETLSPVPPERFPQLVLGAMALLAIVLAIRAPREEAPLPKLPGAVYATAGALVIVVVLIPWLGALPTIFFFLLALPRLWGERRHGALVVYAVSVPAAVYGLFAGLLEIRFPWGVFEAFFE